MRIIVQNPFTQAYFAIEFSEETLDSIQACDPEPTPFYLSSGLCDLQINGAFGIELNAPDLDTNAVHALNQLLLNQGITAWCPTIITNHPDRIRHNFAILHKACEENPLTAACIAGFHLEGPYLSPQDGARGAHEPAFIHPPNWDEFQSFQTAAGGRIRIVTLAPETEGAIVFIQQLCAENIIPALGHTLADEGVIAQAVAAGAQLATHLGNGLPALLDRHHNPFITMLTNDHLSASVIFDGHHLPPNVRTLIRRTKPLEKTIMVSDATRLAGMPPGSYEEAVGGKVELNEHGRLSLSGTPYLAGAAMTLLEDMQVALKDPDISLPEILTMASRNPRALLNLQQDSLVIIKHQPHTHQLEVRFTALNGQIHFQNLSIS